MSDGPPASIPQAASMGSSGTASMVSRPAKSRYTSTSFPGFRPARSLILAGMTTCPLADIFTTTPRLIAHLVR